MSRLSESACLHSPLPHTTNVSDDSTDGTSFGVDIGLHNKEESLSEDTIRLIAQVSTFTMHARMRGNLSMPFIVLKEENKPEEEHVGGEAPFRVEWL